MDVIEETALATEAERAAEAESRLEYLVRKGLHGNVLREWRENRHDCLYYGEVQDLGFARGPVLYWVKNNPEYMAAVADIEEALGCTVYYCILNHTTIGDMLSMLYVSSQKDEWEYDRDDLKQGIPYAYVLNLDDPALSDLGRIGIEVSKLFGGLVRTA